MAARRTATASTPLPRSVVRARTNGYGINANVASDCNGTSSTSTGVRGAFTARNCYGSSNGNGNGVLAKVAINCYGSAAGTGAGVSADVATSCEGVNTGNGSGISCSIANGCYGTGTTNGIDPTYIVFGSYGNTSSTSVASGDRPIRTTLGDARGIVAFSRGDRPAGSNSVITTGIAYACTGANLNVPGDVIYKYFCSTGPTTYP